MSVTVLDSFPVELNGETLKKRLGVRGENKRTGRFAEILAEAERVARPKALYREAFVDGISGDEVTLDGITFKSRVMRANLKAVGRVFLYATTCGVEIEVWSKGIEDVLEKYWSNGIKEYLLGAAIEALIAHVMNRFETGKLGSMNPGSLPDWPIDQQGRLISMLGDLDALIGVTLSSGMMMGPVNSVTGILFPTETGYENCRLCPRKNCPNRRAPFDATCYAETML